MYSIIITFHWGQNTGRVNKIHGGKRQSLNVTKQKYYSETCLNPLKAELNPIRHLLALVEARHIVHVSRIRVKQNLGKIETSLKQETFTVPRIQISSTSKKWNLPATEKISVPCHSVTGKFHSLQIP